MAFTEPNVADDGAILSSNDIDNRAHVALRSCKDEQHRCRETSRGESSSTAIVAEVHEVQERGDDNDGKEAEGEERADAESDIESDEAEYDTAVDCFAELDFGT